MISAMRVVSLLASGTEIVCALGAGDWLIGRSHECDNPSWVARLPCCSSPAFDVHASSGAIDAEVRRRLKAKEPLYHIDAPMITQLKPDLLIAQAHCEVCAVTPQNVEDAHCHLGKSQVLALQAGTLAGIYEGVTNIAQAIDRASAGRQLVQTMQQRFEEIRGAVASKPRPTLVMLEWTDPIFAMANWGPELVEIANGELVLGHAGQHSQAIDWSDVRRADPEYLIIAPCGYNLPRALNEISVMEKYPGWFDLQAVKRGKVVFADGNLYFNRSGMTVVDTAEIISDILHGTALHAPPDEPAWQHYSPGR